MTVAEIKAKCPEAEVYALNENARYLVVVCSHQVSYVMRDRILSELPKDSMLLLVDDPATAIRLLEVID